MRVLLPILAGGLVLLLLIWPQIVKRRDFISDVLKTSAVPLNPNAQIDMKKVLFYSEDNKGQPFQLAADKIWEIDSVNKVVQIDYPKGEMLLNSGVKLFSNSQTAFLYQEKGEVHFKEKVHLNSDNGYRIETSNVFVDYQNQLSYSDKPISVRGEKIDLDATAFKMRQNGDEVDFTGPIKLVLKDVAKGQNILITANGLTEARQKTQAITFHKNVIAYYDKNKIFCDKMTAYFKSKGGHEYDLKSVQAQKNVKITTENEVITGDDAFYDMEKEKAFITGNVVITKAEGNMKGDRAVVDMKTGLSQLEANSKKKSGQRVKGTLYPTKIKK
ncbi:MAG: LPS export ABC transporter periplasmic protein LptC [Alphaproteobacteria bacterium]|nr:LPS export ABC transporter periplasmic protein LptC [Alphaproteobacteria bacterium]